MASHVTAVVLNWNNYQDTRRCLESLGTIDYADLSIVVVDNGSTDQSGQKIEGEFPGVTVLFNATNRGFSGGMNRGIEDALDRGSDFIWLLNNDVLFPDSSVLTDLVETLNASKEVGAISPLVRKYPETDRIWFWRGKIDWQHGRAAHAPEEEYHQTTSRFCTNEYLPFCTPLFRADAFRDVGLLSEKYFLYYEDVDFSIRLRSAGYRLLTDTEARADHLEGASSGGEDSPITAYYGIRNRCILKNEHPGRFGRRFYLGYAKDVGYHAKKNLKARSFDSVLAGLRGAIDGLVGRIGKGPYP